MPRPKKTRSRSNSDRDWELQTRSSESSVMFQSFGDDWLMPTSLVIGRLNTLHWPSLRLQHHPAAGLRWHSTCLGRRPNDRQRNEAVLLEARVLAESRSGLWPPAYGHRLGVPKNHSTGCQRYPRAGLLPGVCTGTRPGRRWKGAWSAGSTRPAATASWRKLCNDAAPLSPPTPRLFWPGAKSSHERVSRLLQELFRPKSSASVNKKPQPNGLAVPDGGGVLTCSLKPFAVQRLVRSNFRSKRGAVHAKSARSHRRLIHTI